MAENATQSTSQVDKNFRAFQDRLPELMVTHAGKLAVMHDGDVVEFFDSYADAVRFGLEKFQSYLNFSVQQVTAEFKSMGFYSYVDSFQQ